MLSDPIPLRCRGVSKRFGERSLFAEVSLALLPRERVALLGPSGAGKSTLLHCLSGVAESDAGEVWLAGSSLQTLAPDEIARCRREHSGSIFQFFHLLPTLTAEENIELPLQLLGHSPRDRRLRVTRLIERMGIAARAKAYPSELSGGEMQRVAIARAVVHQPAVIFADEPTGNLDRANGTAVLQLLQEITEEENAALLMVTHSEEAAAICSRRFLLDDGKFIALP